LLTPNPGAGLGEQFIQSPRQPDYNPTDRSGSFLLTQPCGPRSGGLRARNCCLLSPAGIRMRVERVSVPSVQRVALSKWTTSTLRVPATTLERDGGPYYSVVSPGQECGNSNDCSDNGGKNHRGQAKIQETQHHAHDLHHKKDPAERSNRGGSGAGQLSEVPAQKCR
jgi:hypothetical protein